MSNGSKSFFAASRLFPKRLRNPATVIYAYCRLADDLVDFGGGEKDFKLVREVVNLPMLYKEFVIDEWQISHAKFLGASGVLLIVSALDKTLLKNLYDAAKVRDLDVIVEVHDYSELESALEIECDIIGINNRNLHTFDVDLNLSLIHI